MPRNDSSTVKTIFVEAAELEPAARAAFLQQECGDDAELRARVEDLLATLDQPESILDASNVGDFLTHSSPAQTLVAGDRVGRFDIVGLIGKGGMGEVYEAQDLHFGDRVALKTIRSEFLTRSDFAARFRREIQLARKVTHPNVCRIYDVGRDTVRGVAVSFLTMELLTGESLCERMERAPLLLDEAIPILRQIVGGLTALHLSQVIHRDFKPANVQLVPCASGTRVVITDFGLAHTITDTAVTEHVTIAGQVLGTPAYMSPEQLNGNNVGPATDVYSLGIVMYEMLTGRRPFQSDNFYACITEKISRTPEPPSRHATLNSHWDDLVLGCLNLQVEKRPQSMQHVLEQVELAICTNQRRHPSALIKRLRKGTPWLGNRRWRRRAVYALAAVSTVALIPSQTPTFRKALMRQLCTALPGNSSFCALPAEKDIAVLPFKIIGKTPAATAAAAGLARYIRDSYERLYPNPDRVCLHLRTDQIADGVQLVLTGEIENAADTYLVRLKVSEAYGKNGHAPLVLRRIDINVPASKATELHTVCLRAFAEALEIQFDRKVWDAWLDSAPSQSESFADYLRGLGYLESGKYDEAIRSFTATTDPAKDFAFAPAQVGLADAYRLLRNKTGDHTYGLKAQHAYQRAATLDRDFGFAGAQKRWGELAASTGNPAQAVEHFSAALALWPFDIQLLKKAASALEATQRRGDAEDLLKQGVERAPHCWLTHNTLADFFSRHGRLPEAESELLEVVRLSPDNANAYHNLAFDYIKQGRLDDAIEMASRSIRLRPFPRTYSTLGRAYLYRSCNGDALINLRKAADLAPEDYVVWANLAEGWYATDPGSVSARDAFQRTIESSRLYLEKSPNNAYALAQHGLNLARLGRGEEAGQYTERALSFAGASNDVRLLAVATFEAAGQRKRALAEMEHALRDGLSLHEAEAAFGLTELRRDRGYEQILKRLNLKRSTDPGGLTPPSTGCPESKIPGTGLITN